MKNINKKIKAVSKVFIEEFGEIGYTGFTVTFIDGTFKNTAKKFNKYRKEEVVLKIVNKYEKYLKLMNGGE